METVVQAINQLDMGLGKCLEARPVLGMDEVWWNVIQEQGKIRNPEPGDGFQLASEGLKVRLTRIDHRKTGADGEGEVDEVFFGGVGQLAEALKLLRRIGFAPEFAVIRIILRAVDVSVHAVLTLEAQEFESVGMGPRRSVETFDHAAKGKGWVVGDDCDRTLLLQAKGLRLGDEIC